MQNQKPYLNPYRITTPMESNCIGKAIMSYFMGGAMGLIMAMFMNAGKLEDPLQLSFEKIGGEYQVQEKDLPLLGAFLFFFNAWLSMLEQRMMVLILFYQELLLLCFWGQMQCQLDNYLCLEWAEESCVIFFTRSLNYWGIDIIRESLIIFQSHIKSHLFNLFLFNHLCFLFDFIFQLLQLLFLSWSEIFFQKFITSISYYTFQCRNFTNYELKEQRIYFTISFGENYLKHLLNYFCSFLVYDFLQQFDKSLGQFSTNLSLTLIQEHNFVYLYNFVYIVLVQLRLLVKNQQNQLIHSLRLPNKHLLVYIVQKWSQSG